MAMRLLAAAGFVLMTATAAAQEIYTYTHTGGGGRQFALGYPVPEPVDSLTPVDGFRSYDSLHARHQELALAYDFVAGHKVGRTLRGRDIFAYTVSDPDALTPDGYSEPAFQVTGGVHAREWQSPEVVTGIIERLVERRSDGWLYEYLVDHTNLVVIPVLNIDGFHQTQRYPARVIVGSDPTNADWPRDGRMRRKNMRGVDTELTTFGDHLKGVDLNRNNRPFAPSVGASNDPDNLIYHGGGSLTEPETRALVNAVSLAPADRLRLYTDFHSFAASFFDRLTNNSRRNAIHGSLISRARATLRALGTGYGRDASGPGTGIGTTDEYFADIIQVPSWTLELEPNGPQGGRQYGGFGAEHDGFILPASEIDRVRNHIADGYAMLFYAQAGPPSIAEVRVLDEGGNVVWGGEWRRTGPDRREFVVTTDGSVVVGNDYRLWIAYDKPMRYRTDSGEASGYPGQILPVHPDILLDGLTQEIAVTPKRGRWLQAPDAPARPGFRRYRDDAHLSRFTVPASIEPGDGEAFRLNVSAEDMAANALDADPSTVVDWNGGHWVAYESSDGTAGDAGGTDSTIRIPVTKEQPVKVTFSADRKRALEGSRVRLSLERETSETALGVGLLAERVVGDGDPSVERLFETRVQFGPAGSTIRTVNFTVPDDFQASGGVSDEVRVTASVTSGNAVISGPATLSVAVEDNDLQGQGVVSILHRHPYTPPPGISPLPTGLSKGKSLAEALRRAQSVDGPVYINLADGGAYTLDVSEGDADTAFPVIEGDVTIWGHDTLIARHEGAGNAFRLFRVAPGAHLTLRGLALERGNPAGNLAGGAVLSEGRLTGERVVFRDNSANRAGALSNEGTGELRLSSFVGNASSAGGGAVFNSGELTLAGATLSGNVTKGRGGAILNQGELILRESTLTGNDGPEGSDLFNAGSVEVVGSVLASSGSCVESFAGATLSDGYNMDADATCGLGSATDLIPGDPLLGPLEAGALHVPKANSPLVAGIPEGEFECLSQDPRGVARPFASPIAFTGPPIVACEIGAAERGISVRRGMWFNPERSGHGIDLQQAGNQLIVTWFTYDTDGTPVWYQASGPFDAMFWEADLYRYELDHSEGSATGEVVGTVSLTFESETEASFAWDLSPIGQGEGAERFEPLVFGDGEPKFDTTGHWAAADGSGWGLSVDVQGEITVATVYYYDADGDPRWVQGSGPAGLDVPMGVASFTGFCPGCDLQSHPFTMTPAGSLDLGFLTREFGRIDTDFSYPGAGGGEWLRNAGLGTLSDPVP